MMVELNVLWTEELVELRLIRECLPSKKLMMIRKRLSMSKQHKNKRMNELVSMKVPVKVVMNEIVPVKVVMRMSNPNP